MQWKKLQKLPALKAGVSFDDAVNWTNPSAEEAAGRYEPTATSFANAADDKEDEAETSNPINPMRMKPSLLPKRGFCTGRTTPCLVQPTSSI